MEKEVPSGDFRHSGELLLAGENDDRSWEAFSKKMEQMIAATKKKNKAVKEKKRQQRIKSKEGESDSVWVIFLLG